MCKHIPWLNSGGIHLALPETFAAPPLSATKHPETEQLQDTGCICWFVMSVPGAVLRHTTTSGRLAVRGALENHPVICIYRKHKGLLLMSRSDTVSQNPVYTSVWRGLCNL
jgi:hypothetical protein